MKESCTHILPTQDRAFILFVFLLHFVQFTFVTSVWFWFMKFKITFIIKYVTVYLLFHGDKMLSVSFRFSC